MLSNLWRLIQRWLGRDPEPPCGPEQPPAEPQRDDKHPDLESAERQEDDPATDWVDRIEQRHGNEDWLRERLRSLADELRGHAREEKDRGHDR